MLRTIILFSLFIALSANDISTEKVPSIAMHGSSDTPTGKFPKLQFDKEEIRARLTDLQYRVTQNFENEPIDSGKYNEFNKKGKYFCIVCDEPLFHSDDKISKRAGYATFNEKNDNIYLTPLNHEKEHKVHCMNCGSYLGVAYDDIYNIIKQNLYVINSASLKFKKLKRQYQGEQYTDEIN